MQILINPTEVELKSFEANPLVGYVPLTFLETRDKDNRLMAIITMETTIDGSYLVMNSFGIRYRTSLIDEAKRPLMNVEEIIEQLLNRANLTTRKKLSEN